MKEIKNFSAQKYTQKDLSLSENRAYKEIEQGIYEWKQEDEILYVTSLSFVQEPEFEEGEYADAISQYPLEDILDKFYCHVCDFYDELNVSDSKICYLEFASPRIEDIKNLRSIIGKHVYNKDRETDGKIYADLIIE